MGMSAGGAGGGGSRRGGRRARRAPMSEINVTPMVDVMLVLLIIFMVAAPMLTVGVPLDLPETQAKALNAETQPIEISIKSDGNIFIGENPIAIEDVVTQLTAVAKTGYKERIFVKGDRAADYGRVAEVMARISTAGFTNIGLVTAPETTG
ncbi:protein TolR [Aureimonas sp. Leaf454]|uniref:protein TolR n=1 Tax=Aureimonas sp. Leaf454 TaxID=1736381 RepID=UPI0006F43C57|nr:protein TolR [Aureimonas sp. Leaf454]KQT54339.1 protein TolR [Aureimonas sp. Leaf454]